MKFEIESNRKIYKFDITEDPLYESVEKILLMDNKSITSLIGAMKNIPQEDQNKDINKYVYEIVANDPDKMSKFLLYKDTSSKIKTIMLCTGLDETDIKKLPYKNVFTVLLEKCKEVLGGTAEDFMKGSGITTQFQGLKVQ